jgi:hypothetical protein
VARDVRPGPERQLDLTRLEALPDFIKLFVPAEIYGGDFKSVKLVIRYCIAE